MKQLTLHKIVTFHVLYIGSTRSSSTYFSSLALALQNALLTSMKSIKPAAAAAADVAVVVVVMLVMKGVQLLKIKKKYYIS